MIAKVWPFDSPDILRLPAGHKLRFVRPLAKAGHDPISKVCDRRAKKFCAVTFIEKLELWRGNQQLLSGADIHGGCYEQSALGRLLRRTQKAGFRDRAAVRERTCPLRLRPKHANLKSELTYKPCAVVMIRYATSHGHPLMACLSQLRRGESHHDIQKILCSSAVGNGHGNRDGNRSPCADG